jgi:hypothetical protein
MVAMMIMMKQLDMVSLVMVGVVIVAGGAYTHKFGWNVST